MDNIIAVIIIIAVVALVCVIACVLISQARRKSNSGGNQSDIERASAFIQSVRDTNWYVNECPQLEFELLIFPPNGPCQVAVTRQVVSFSFIPSLRPGKYVDVTFEAGRLKYAHIEGLKKFEVTGEPFDMSYFDNLSEKIQTDSAQTEGTVVSLAETGSFVDLMPIYRIKAAFKTEDGRDIEPETNRVLRPWFQEQLKPGNTVKIVYCRQNPALFSIIE